jgi:tetratricopeptide (TPR) repeat protein
VVLDHPSFFAPLDQLISREVLTAAARRFQEVYLWLDVGAYRPNELPRILHTFATVFAGFELFCSQSGYAGPYLCLRGSQRALPPANVRDVDHWRAIGARAELWPGLSALDDLSLVGTRLLGRVPSPLENPGLPLPEVLRELALYVPEGARAVADLFTGLALHAQANPSTSTLESIAITKEELAAYLRAAEHEPFSRLLVNHFASVCELLLQQREYERLRDFTVPLAELNPTEARFFYYTGKIGADLADPELSVEPLEKALELDPTSVRALETLATVRGNLGDWDKAVELLERATSLDPTRKHLEKRLGIAHLRAGHREEARRHLTAALQSEPDDPETLKALDELK